jgi:hypothetical protein
MREIEFTWTRQESVRADLGRDLVAMTNAKGQFTRRPRVLHFQQDAIARLRFAQQDAFLMNQRLLP